MDFGRRKREGRKKLWLPMDSQIYSSRYVFILLFAFKKKEFYWLWAKIIITLTDWKLKFYSFSNNFSPIQSWYLLIENKWRDWGFLCKLERKYLNTKGNSLDSKIFIQMKVCIYSYIRMSYIRKLYNIEKIIIDIDKVLYLCNSV